MKILELSSRLQKYLKRQNLEKKFSKQKSLFEQNPGHPSLNTELLEPKKMRIYSFRVDRKYRAFFVYIGHETIEIIDINLHYQ